jgi:hypothetical protein
MASLLATGLSDLGIMKSQQLIIQLISIFQLRTFQLYVAAPAYGVYLFQ